jgi:hypothetical protein
MVQAATRWALAMIAIRQAAVSIEVREDITRQGVQGRLEKARGDRGQVRVA